MRSELLETGESLSFLLFNLRKKADSSKVSDAFLFSGTHNWLS